jgi:Zn-finger protein
MSSRCFTNRDCDYFPCHDGIPAEQFNCLFCYCPLYALGERCGGAFTYTESGIKDCSGCAVPHWAHNYDAILSRFPELAALAARKNPNKTENTP